MTLICPALHLVSKYLPSGKWVNGLSNVVKNAWTVRQKGYVTVGGEDIKLPSHHNKIVPSKAVNEVVQMLKETDRCVEKVDCPLLVVTSKFDIVVDVNSAKDIHRRASSKEKQLVKINSLEHVVIQGRKRKQINKELDKFLEAQLNR